MAIRRAYATSAADWLPLCSSISSRRTGAASVKLPKVTTRRVEPWTLDEAERFLDAAAQHRLGALFELAVMTSMRRGELGRV